MRIINHKKKVENQKEYKSMKKKLPYYGFTYSTYRIDTKERKKEEALRKYENEKKYKERYKTMQQDIQNELWRVR